MLSIGSSGITMLKMALLSYFRLSYFLRPLHFCSGHFYSIFKL